MTHDTAYYTDPLMFTEKLLYPNKNPLVYRYIKYNTIVLHPTLSDYREDPPIFSGIDSN